MPMNDYYYGNEAEQYTFYRLPKALFTNERYKKVSDGAKILYGLMLDRMGLSIKNGWLDENNRVYIYFTLEDVLEYMNCKQDKGVKMLAELDSVKGIGLIERVKQGQGKPTIIYVKKFVTDGAPANRTSDLGKSEVLTSEKPKSRLPENRSADFGFSEANNNKYNNTYVNNTESINPSVPPDTMETIDMYREIIMENIEYDALVRDNPYSRGEIDEVVELMLETVCSKRKSIRIGGEDKPTELVKSRFLKLDHSHIIYVLDSLSKNTTDVRNTRSYLLTTLFNAPTTIEHYYRLMVNRDMYGDSQ